MDGKPVVELTGGFFDQSYNPEKLYTDDTLQLVFSSTKAVTGIAVAHLVSSGHLSYSEKVSTYWPEFAVGNKVLPSMSVFAIKNKTSSEL